jgi:hypothetical protein
MGDKMKEDTSERERAYLVSWMRNVIAGKKTLTEKKAFMAKVNSVAIYHNITLEELMEDFC